MHEQHDLEQGAAGPQGQRLAPEHRRGGDPGGPQGVERAVLGLDGERPLHQHQQAEHGAQAGQPGRQLDEELSSHPAPPAGGRRRRRTAPS